jgi:hypothetical protein
MSDGTKRHESGLVLMTLPPGIEGGRSEEVIVWMSRPVAARLLKLGFEQPVELDSLPGRWWSILVDLYTLDEVSEPGCGFRRAVANTETVAAYFGMGWLRIDAGPFDSANEAEAVYLAAAGTDTAWLGPDAKVVRVAPWISRKLSERGFPTPSHSTSWQACTGSAVCPRGAIRRSNWKRGSVANVLEWTSAMGPSIDSMTRSTTSTGCGSRLSRGAPSRRATDCAAHRQAWHRITAAPRLAPENPSPGGLARHFWSGAHRGMQHELRSQRQRQVRHSCSSPALGHRARRRALAPGCGRNRPRAGLRQGLHRLRRRSSLGQRRRADRP